MNRFEQKSMSLGCKLIYLLPILAFVILFVLFLRGIGSVGESTLSKQQESLETALERSISQCYAVILLLWNIWSSITDCCMTRTASSLTMNIMAATFFRKSLYFAGPVLTKGVSDI